MPNGTRPWPACLAIIIGLGGTARAQDLRFEAGEQLYAITELMEGGDPLWNQLFAHGWPTDAAHRRLTQEIARVGVDALMPAYLGSGAGVPLSATAYEEARAARAQRASAGITAAALLRTELNTYKRMSGATWNIPATFDPVAIPYHRARAELARPYDPADLASLRWKETSGARQSLDALGFAMLAEARYARLQLTQRREAQVDGKNVKLFGATPESGFFALVALHAAVAKLHEVKRLIVDTRSEQLAPRDSLAGLEEFRFLIPSGWTTRVDGGQAVHELLEGDDKLKSHLFGLSALLLGAAELVELSEPEGSPLKDLFGDRAVDPGTTAMFERDTYEQALDVALFAFRSLRSLHVDFNKGSATSVAHPQTRSNTITPTDLGLCLMALEAFKLKVQLSAKNVRHARAAEITDEQRKVDVLLRTLGNSFRQWAADEPGMYDVYTIAANARQAPTKALASQAFAVRGLLVTHRHLGEGSPMLQPAERTLRWLDRERWDAGSQAYVERAQGAPASPGGKASALGAVAVLGALRDMALTTNDGRYLTRYRQYLEGLAERGLFRAATDRAAAGVAPEVTFEPK
jgi:hypothetical protein